MFQTAHPPGYVTLQGTQCPTFLSPPLDGTMYVPEMVDWHLQWSEDHPYMILVGQESEENVTITWGEAARAVHRLVATFLKAVHDCPTKANRKPHTVALLINTDSLIYYTIVMALLRAGFEPFPLSTRNSIVALKHLVETTRCSFLLGPVPRSDAPPSSLENKTASLMDEIPGLTLLHVPTTSQLYPRLSRTPVEVYDKSADAGVTPIIPQLRSLPSYQNAVDRWPCLILHSSGSTGFPKPIHIHQEVWLAWSCLYWYGDVDICGTIWASLSLPAFHGMGILYGAFVPMCHGSVATAFKPSEPTQIATPENTLRAAGRCAAHYMLAPPIFCERFSEDHEAIQSLKALRGLMYGGGPLIQEAGDRLVTGGVNLLSAYGVTDAGPISKHIPLRPLSGVDWPYVEFSPNLKTRLLQEEGRIYRLVVLENDSSPLPAWNIPGEEAFDVNDLVEEHPIHKGFWRVVGRADDQIMMSNGEKTNPGPLETIIAVNPAVRAVMIFGRSRPQIGVAIEPSKHVDIMNEAELENFCNEIWPDVEKANAFGPSHSRIFKEFILVVDPLQKPFIRTPKGTLSKNAILKQYEQEINAVYDAAEQSIDSDWAKLPEQWDEPHIRAFVATVVNGVMRGEASKQADVDEARDLFEQGCDSLQATYIRQAILNVIRQAPQKRTNVDKGIDTTVQQNLVYVHPSVIQLTNFLVEIVVGTSSIQTVEEDKTQEVAAMLAMVDKYSAHFTVATFNEGNSDQCEGEVVLLTGSTGTLGTYLLRTLLLDPQVGRVYAVNRHSHSMGLWQRQAKAFEDRGVDLSLLQSPKLRLVEADITRSDLSLNIGLLEEIRSSLTVVIHNAWRMDFNLSLASFEPHVKATRSLVDLALSCTHAGKPQFILISSIGTVLNWRHAVPVPEEPITDPQTAYGNGYAESKWVAEQVIIKAVDKGLNPTIWRVGQLSGSITNGAWNTSDWVPIIVKAGQVMGGLPASLGATVSWLPTDKAAETIAEAMHKGAVSGLRYLHLVNPHRVKWDMIFTSISDALSVPLIPYGDWVSLLQKAALNDPNEIKRNPAIKLFDFLRTGLNGRGDILGGDSAGNGLGDAMEPVHLDTAKAVQASVTLASLEPLEVNQVLMWLKYWTKHGLLD